MKQNGFFWKTVAVFQMNTIHRVARKRIWKLPLNATMLLLPQLSENECIRNLRYDISRRWTLQLQNSTIPHNSYPCSLRTSIVERDSVQKIFRKKEKHHRLCRRFSSWRKWQKVRHKCMSKLLVEINRKLSTSGRIGERFCSNNIQGW